jgi:hypothetical protein
MAFPACSKGREDQQAQSRCRYSEQQQKQTQKEEEEEEEEEEDGMEMELSLWMQDAACLAWLDKQEPGSVVYANFGSLTYM